MTLDARDEQLVRVRFRVLDEVRWGLLRGNSNKGNTLVGGLEPDDLRALDLAAGLVALVALAFAALSLLLLLRRSGRGTKETQSTREQLPRHALYDRDDVASELGLNLVSDPTGMVSTRAILDEKVRTLRPRTT